MNLETYLNELLKIKHENTQNFPPSPAQIQELQTQLGFTQEDKERLEQLFGDFLTRGKNFGKYTQWQKAIKELTEASHLKPWDKEANFLLADAHCQAFLKNGNPNHKKQALFYADIALKLDPNNEFAIQVIAKVEKRQVNIWQNTNLRNNFLKIVGVLVGIYVIFWIFSGENNHNAQNDEEKPAKAPEVKIIEKKTYKENNVRVSWTNGGMQGKWFMEKSVSEKTANGYEYQLVGAWQTLENKNLINLVAEITLYDEQNQLLKQEKLQFLSDSLAEMWKNDALPINIVQKNLKNQVKKAKIEILTWEFEPENIQNAVKDIEIANSFIEFKLECRERHQLIRPNADDFNHEIVFSIKNDSKIPIQELKIKMQWFYKNNSLAHEQIFTPQNPYFSTWQIGETRAYKHNFLVPMKLSDYKGYKMEVLEVE